MVTKSDIKIILALWKDYLEYWKKQKSEKKIQEQNSNKVS
jgi:hypothetical protein